MSENNVVYKNERITLDIALDEMKKTLSRQFEGLDIFKETAKNLFGASSLVLSLIGALQLVRPNIVNEWVCIYNAMIILALSLYAFMLAICLWVILPTKLYQPVGTDWDEIYKFFTGDEIFIYRNYLLAYTKTVEEMNPPVLRSRRIALYIAGILLFLIISLLLLLSLIPRVSMI